MKGKTFNILVLAVLLVGIVFSAQPAFALSLPSGTTIDSATLSIHVNQASGETVNVHRITADWSETGVTWANFGGSYDPTVVGSFVADSPGWKSVDITSLVQEWADGTPNFGVLLEQGLTPYTTYRSSEFSEVSLRPKFEICYEDGGLTCVTIQRGTYEDVADAYIWDREEYRDSNFGGRPILYTGFINSGAKQSLLRFDLELIPPPPGGGEGCTPGYWKQEQHFDSWVGFSQSDNYLYDVFGVGFDATLLAVLQAGGGGEIALGRHSVAALLNASNLDVDYAYTEAEIIQMVQDAYAGDVEFEDVKDLFEYENELGCPLD